MSELTDKIRFMQRLHEHDPEHAQAQFHTFTNWTVTPRFTVGGGAIYMSKVCGGIQEVSARTITSGFVVVPN